MQPLNGMSHFTEATMQDILDNPHKYGAPTLAEYSVNPDKWKLPHDHIAIAVDAGSKNLDKHVKQHWYQWKTGKTQILELVEKWIKNDGYDWSTVDIKPEIIDRGGRWCDILVKFVPLKSKDAEAGREAMECPAQT